ncbi:MAG: response regulator [Halobacteriovorax sp.]|nr:response regulator [Halobacteriovorax sp.]
MEKCMPLKASMSILVVDSSPTMRQSVKKLLSNIGFKNVKEAVDGTKALEFINLSLEENTPVEFIICEYQLEKMNIIELTSKLRNSPAKAIKILLMTGDSDQQKMMQAIRAGVNNVIVKPFSADTLQDKIAKIFNQ